MHAPRASRPSCLAHVPALHAAADLETVNLEPVLLADTSGSVDEAEILLQRRGCAGALVDLVVLFAVTNVGGGGRVALAHVD